MKVIIFEDNILLQTALEKALRDLSDEFKVHSFGRLSDALAALEKGNSYELALLDIVENPTHSKGATVQDREAGFKLAEALRAKEAMRTIPIIFLSANLDDEVIKNKVQEYAPVESFDKLNGAGVIYESDRDVNELPETVQKEVLQKVGSFAGKLNKKIQAVLDQQEAYEQARNHFARATNGIVTIVAQNRDEDELYREHWVPVKVNKIVAAQTITSYLCEEYQVVGREVDIPTGEQEAATNTQCVTVEKVHTLPQAMHEHVLVMAQFENRYFLMFWSLDEFKNCASLQELYGKAEQAYHDLKAQQNDNHTSSSHSAIKPVKMYEGAKFFEGSHMIGEDNYEKDFKLLINSQRLIVRVPKEKKALRITVDGHPGHYLFTKDLAASQFEKQMDIYHEVNQLPNPFCNIDRGQLININYINHLEENKEDDGASYVLCYTVQQIPHKKDHAKIKTPGRKRLLELMPSLRKSKMK